MMAEPTEGFHLGYKLREDPALTHIPIIIVSGISEKLASHFLRKRRKVLLYEGGRVPGQAGQPADAPEEPHSWSGSRAAPRPTGKPREMRSCRAGAANGGQASPAMPTGPQCPGGRGGCCRGAGAEALRLQRHTAPPRAVAVFHRRLQRAVFTVIERRPKLCVIAKARCSEWLFHMVLYAVVLTVLAFWGGIGNPNFVFSLHFSRRPRRQDFLSSRRLCYALVSLATALVVAVESRPATLGSEPCVIEDCGCAGRSGRSSPRTLCVRHTAG